MKLLEIFEDQFEIKKFFKKYEHVHIFGAGLFSEALLFMLDNWGLNPEEILVTEAKVQCFRGIRVQSLDTSRKYNGALVLAVSSKYHSEILKVARKCFDKIIIIPDSFFCFAMFIKNLEIKKGDVWEKCNDVSVLPEKIKKHKTIILQRVGGMGDALIAEPICRQLKKMGFAVGVMTKYKEVFRYCKSVDFLSYSSGELIFDDVIYINLIYELDPFNHILDSYCNIVKQFVPQFKIMEEDRIPVYDSSLIRNHSEDINSICNICLNTEASGWRTRIYNHGKMKCFAEYLLRKGFKIYEIGSDEKNYLGVGENCFGLSLRETIKLMSKSDLYMGFDNGLMHLAQSIKLPIFIMFGCVCPLYRIHDWSRARVMWKNVDKLFCAGCYHRRQTPCREPVCLHDECYCLDWSVDEVIYAFENLKYNNPPVLDKKMFNLNPWCASKAFNI